MTIDIILKVISVLMLSVWWFLVVNIGWNGRYGKTHNIIYGTLVFFAISIIYMFPAWTFFR